MRKQKILKVNQKDIKKQKNVKQVKKQALKIKARLNNIKVTITRLKYINHLNFLVERFFIKNVII